ncbi:MAG: hypothetical protein ABII21_04205 [bacterium]
MSKLKIFLLIFFSTCLAYGASLKYGFSQDDWYFLLISQANNFQGVVNFFNPFAQSGFAFFRPLGTQLYYFLFTSAFGLSRAPLFMHIFMLILQGSCGYLVYRLAAKLKFSPSSAFLIGLVYATSSAQFLSLFYIAATQQLLAAFFGLLSLNYFLVRRHWLSAIFFLLALISKETAIIIPFIAITLSLLTTTKLNLKSMVTRFMPYTLYLILYTTLRLLAPHAVQAEYHFTFGLNVLSTLRWYILFAFNAPEEWLRYATPHLGINLLQFIRDFGLLGFSITTLTLSSLLLFLVSLIRSSLRKCALYLSWFVLALAPVLFLLDHRYPHYLDLALVPLILLLYHSFRGKWQYLLTAILIVGSVCNIYLSERIHWTTGRAKMASSALSAIDWSSTCPHSAIIFTGPKPFPLELSYTLSLANGPRVICQNPKLGVYYQEVVPSEGTVAFPIDISPVFKSYVQP